MNSVTISHAQQLPLELSSDGKLQVEGSFSAPAVSQVRSSTAIAGGSWAADASEGAMIVDGYRTVSFSVVFGNTTATAAHFLTIETSADGTTWYPLQDVGFEKVQSGPDAHYACRGTLAGLVEKHVRWTNYSGVAQTTKSPLLVTRQD